MSNTLTPYSTKLVQRVFAEHFARIQASVRDGQPFTVRDVVVCAQFVLNGVHRPAVPLPSDNRPLMASEEVHIRLARAS